MIKVEIKKDEFKMNVFYNDKGLLEYVENANTGENMMIEIIMSGGGHEIQRTGSAVFGQTIVCDARYARVLEANVFIPRLLFVEL